MNAAALLEMIVSDCTGIFEHVACCCYVVYGSCDLGMRLQFWALRWVSQTCEKHISFKGQTPHRTTQTMAFESTHKALNACSHGPSNA
eukprot:1732112-Amphidinium_carterae.1